MPHNRPLEFKVATHKDFIVPIGFLLLLSLISAMLSPQPVFLTILVLVIAGAGWFNYRSDGYKLNDVKSMVVIFPDGRIRLESNQQTVVEGLLCQQQWTTQHIAILRYTDRDERHSLVLLAAQQNVDEYRRLKVWIRHGFRAALEAGTNVTGRG